MKKKICIAGKNLIAIKGVQISLKLFKKFGPILAIPNETDNGEDFWQPSFKKYAKKFCDDVKTHASVFVGQFSKIGNYVWMFPYVVLANDPHPPSDDNTKGPEISDFAVIASQYTIFPNIKIGKGALVGAGCVLTKNLPEEQIAVGNPGKIIGHVSKIKIKGTNKSAYPWRYHFHRGYPKNIVDSWMKERLLISKSN